MRVKQWWRYNTHENSFLRWRFFSSPSRIFLETVKNCARKWKREFFLSWIIRNCVWVRWSKDLRGNSTIANCTRSQNFLGIGDDEERNVKKTHEKANKHASMFLYCKWALKKERSHSTSFFFPSRYQLQQQQSHIHWWRSVATARIAILDATLIFLVKMGKFLEAFQVANRASGELKWPGKSIFRKVIRF